MDTTTLRAREGKTGVLRFTDGHTVRARLVHVDSDDRGEIVYDIVEVIDRGPARWAGVRAGTTAAAALSEVVDFDVLDH